MADSIHAPHPPLHDDYRSNSALAPLREPLFRWLWIAAVISYIGKWMQMFIKPGEIVEQRDHESMQDFVTRIEKAAVFRSLENLTTFPFVQASVERGALQLHGAYFGVAEGSLFVLDRTAKEFRSVREAHASE